MNAKEIINDINRVYESYDNSVKKEVAAKYEINSKKKDEIISILYKKIIELRHQENRKKFTLDDIKAFNRTYSYSTNKKAVEAFKDEPIEFMKFMRDYFDKLYKKHGESYAGKSYHRTRDCIDHAIFLKENEDSINEAKEISENIFNALVILTQDYRNDLNKKVLETEERNFNSVKDLDPKELREKKQFNTLRFYNLASVKSDKFQNPQKYFDYINKDFNENFDHNLKAIAERLKQHGLTSGENMEIQLIDEDPKFIELILKTKVGTFNCRSIIAAASSSYMRTHLRFIITKKS